MGFQLVPFLLSTLEFQIYHSFHVYCWPSAVRKEIDRHIRNFIWSGDPIVKKICIVAWKQLCKPVKEGGLGIKSLKSLSEAVLLKISFELIASNKECATFLRSKFFHHNKPVHNYVRSSLWLGIKIHMHSVFSNTVWHIGDGSSINFWRDKWLSQPLVDLVHFPQRLQHNLNAKVSDFIKYGCWNIPESLFANLHILG